MFAEERKKKILDLLENKDSVKVADLSSIFNVSEATIRRDLQELERQNLLQRTHGGAVKRQKAGFEPSFLEKEDKYLAEKEAIAKKSLEFITPGDTILLDSGTTTRQIASLLKNITFELNVVTNSIIIAHELMGNDNINLVLTGGELRQKTFALVGPLAEASLAEVNVDKVFLAANGIHIENGLTTPSLAEAEVKKAMIQAGGQIIVVVDSSKFGKAAFASVVPLSEVNVIITDSKLDENYYNRIMELGIGIVKAEE